MYFDSGTVLCRRKSTYTVVYNASGAFLRLLSRMCKQCIQENASQSRKALSHVCAKCTRTLPHTCFSPKQLNSKKKRCKDCVAENWASTHTSSPMMACHHTSSPMMACHHTRVVRSALDSGIPQQACTPGVLVTSGPPTSPGTFSANALAGVCSGFCVGFCRVSVGYRRNLVESLTVLYAKDIGFCFRTNENAVYF